MVGTPKEEIVLTDFYALFGLDVQAITFIS